MRRRAALSVAAGAILAAAPGTVAPIDEARINHFAGLWNFYLEQLRRGVIDLKAWAATEKAWERLR